MECVNLGRTGLKVSRLCLGTMNFGPFADEPQSFAIMDKALELGINFFDTANVYGWKLGEGVTEKIIGRWLAQGQGRREQIVLATKVFGKMGEGPNDQGLSAYHIRRACDESLRRLRTDHIDLYQMHHVDPQTPWEEIWQAMEQLIHAGKILYVGSSNFAAWHIVRANAVAAERHLLGIVSEQSLYNLKVRAAELEVLPMCQALGVGVLPWSPLAAGLLAGVLQERSNGRRAKEDLKRALQEHRSQVEQYEAFCRELGEPPAAVALAWLLHNPAVTSPILGPRTVDQLVSAMRALEIRLTPEEMGRLDQIWPGPGGPAPQAYAW
ncbi:MAG: aldo/keto reductase [Candidatus Oleimicrobiaceae bacterium]